MSRPRTMHDEIRTGRPYGDALSIPCCREAHTKTTLSFQNLEAALPLGIPAGRRSNSRSSVLYLPELATIGSIPAANGRCAWRDREVWMQSEPCLPRIILAVYPRQCGEESRSRFLHADRPDLHVDPKKPLLFRACKIRFVAPRIGSTGPTSTGVRVSLDPENHRPT